MTPPLPDEATCPRGHRLSGGKRTTDGRIECPRASCGATVRLVDALEVALL